MGSCFPSLKKTAVLSDGVLFEWVSMCVYQRSFFFFSTGFHFVCVCGGGEEYPLKNYTTS